MTVGATSPDGGAARGNRPPLFLLISRLRAVAEPHGHARNHAGPAEGAARRRPPGARHPWSPGRRPLDPAPPPIPRNSGLQCASLGARTQHRGRFQDGLGRATPDRRDPTSNQLQGQRDRMEPWRRVCAIGGAGKPWRCALRHHARQSICRDKGRLQPGGQPFGAVGDCGPTCLSRERIQAFRSNRPLRSRLCHLKRDADPAIFHRALERFLLGLVDGHGRRLRAQVGDLLREHP